MFVPLSVPASPAIGLCGVEGPRAGPALWLVHGLSRCWEDFAPLLPHLAPRWHLRALSHRGHGTSARAPGAYRVADYVPDLVAAVRAAGEPCALVGHSLGALVALGAAAAVPELVSGVALLDPPGPEFLAHLDRTPYFAVWAALQRFAGRADTSAVARELADLRLPDGAGGTARYGDTRDAANVRFVARCLRDVDPGVFDPPLRKRWLDGFDPIATARRVRCPALLVVADPARGGVLTPADATALAAALPDGSRADLPGTGHLVHWQDAPGTLRLLHAFLHSL